MVERPTWSSRCVHTAVLVLASANLAAPAEAAAPLKLVQEIPLADVDGRLDHLGVDVDGRRLFVAAVQSNTVEVIDLAAGRRTGRIEGLSKPHSVVYLPELRQLVVTNGGGSLDWYDGKSLALTRRVEGLRDADTLRYDAAVGQLYVGYGNGLIAILNAKTGERVGELRIGGRTEGFELDPGRPVLYANAPTIKQIVVVDLDQRQLLSEWWLNVAIDNYAMAFDPDGDHVIVGLRKPPTIIMLEADTGQVAGVLPTVGDADDLWYDAARRRLYVSGGEGALHVIERNVNELAPMSRILTVPGARTSLYVAALNRLYLAVPRRGEAPAEIRVYEAQ